MYSSKILLAAAAFLAGHYVVRSVDPSGRVEVSPQTGAFVGGILI